MFMARQDHQVCVDVCGLAMLQTPLCDDFAEASLYEPDHAAWEYDAWEQRVWHFSPAEESVYDHTDLRKTGRLL